MMGDRSARTPLGTKYEISNAKVALKPSCVMSANSLTSARGEARDVWDCQRQNSLHRRHGQGHRDADQGDDNEPHGGSVCAPQYEAEAGDEGESERERQQSEPSGDEEGAAVSGVVGGDLGHRRAPRRRRRQEERRRNRGADVEYPERSDQTLH